MIPDQLKCIEWWPPTSSHGSVHLLVAAGHSNSGDSIIVHRRECPQMPITNSTSECVIFPNPCMPWISVWRIPKLLFIALQESTMHWWSCCWAQTVVDGKEYTLQDMWSRWFMHAPQEEAEEVEWRKNGFISIRVEFESREDATLRVHQRWSWHVTFSHDGRLERVGPGQWSLCSGHLYKMRVCLIIE